MRCRVVVSFGSALIVLCRLCGLCGLCNVEDQLQERRCKGKGRREGGVDDEKGFLCMPREGGLNHYGNARLSLNCWLPLPRTALLQQHHHKNPPS